MSTRFPTRRDASIVVLIWLSSLVAAAGGLYQMGGDAPLSRRLAILAALLGAGGAMLWSLYATEYQVDDEELRVRSGPFRYRIPLARIDSVTFSRDPRTSPAASLDRLLIRWSPGERELLISPDREREFLDTLLRGCPHLLRHGDQLTRRR